MADKQPAPQAHEDQLQPGSLWEAQAALLKMTEPEGETPETEEATPTEEEESQPVAEDESFEEESEEEEEAEEAEEESEETDGEEEELYAVTVNGEEQAVTLDELLSGYSRQSDYTRKTQEIASERKGMEELQQQYNSHVAQIQQERQQYVEALTNMISSQGSELEQYSNIDWDTLRESDPIEYVTAKEQYREAQERVQGMQYQQQQAAQAQQAEMTKAHHQVVQAERGKLVEALPEWGDPDKQKELSADLQSYARDQGFSQQELNSLVDHRSVLVLLKAQQYDQLQNSDVKSKKLKNKPKVIRSGTGTTSKGTSKSKRAAKMKRLQGSGHVDDAASILEDMFNS